MGWFTYLFLVIQFQVLTLKDNSIKITKESATMIPDFFSYLFVN